VFILLVNSVGQQLSSGITKENCLSDGNFGASDGLSRMKSSHCGSAPREILPDVLCKPETLPTVAVNESEYFPIGAVKPEPTEVSNAVKLEPTEASSNVIKSEPIEASNAVKSEPIEASNAVKPEPIEAASNTASSAPAAGAARHMFQHNVSWLTAPRSTGVQKLSHAKNAGCHN